MAPIGYQQSTVPNGLPKLPGNGFKDPTNTSFKKSHLFDVHQGIPVTYNAEAVSKSVDLIGSTGSFGSMPVVSAPPPAGAEEPAPVQPAWVAFDRKVLQFSCYFKEAVVESRAENYRVRACQLYYYLEDDSIPISEPKVENSGIPQGEHKGATFLKRHRIPKSDGTFFNVGDLKIGAELEIYHRVYKVTDCDAFTRSFYETLGMPHEEPLPTPEDPYQMTRNALKQQVLRNQLYFHPKPHEDDLQRNMEARLGCSSTLLEPDKLDQFLKFDRQVLRFYAAWDDRPRLYGELRPFVLNYYLADDTMEILEVRRANSGRDPFPMFLKRGKVYKNIDSYLHIDAPTTHTSQLIDRTGRVDPSTMDTFKETDLAVGKELTFNGAKMLLYGVDEFTRGYYSQVYGVDFHDIPVEFDEVYERPRLEIPMHNAPGSEDDTIGSFLYLLPKVPKKNQRRMMENDRKIMRFSAVLDTDAEEDKGRIFIVKYFLADDTIQVFEPPLKNSGLQGGCFLSRKTYKKKGTEEYFTQSDFHVGASIELTYTFNLFDADEYTLSYMESEPTLHPFSSMEFIAEQLRPRLDEKRAECIAACEEKAMGKTTISYEHFQLVLSDLGIELAEQVLITILRAYDTSKSGEIEYATFFGAPHL